MSLPGLDHRRPVREPLFLDSGVVAGVRTLVGDFVNFVLVLAFYPLCWLIGGAAFLIDNMFRTGLFDRFINAVEFIDNGGR